MAIAKLECVLLGHRTLWSALSQEWMNELNYFFGCSYMVSEKLKVTLDMHMFKCHCDLLSPGILKSTLSQLKNKLMN